MGEQILRKSSFVASVSLMVLALNGWALAGAVAVPEIDPGAVVSGVSILAGAALLLVERFRGQ